jgi:hypothetical protein
MELTDMDVGERQAYVQLLIEQIEKENQQIEEARRK